MRILVLLVSFLFSTLTLSAAAAAPEAVLDITGKKLQKGIDYYIQPVSTGNGGGLSLSSTRNKTCPLDVVQYPSPTSIGSPLKFSPEKGQIVRVSTDMNIKFAASTTCVQSTVWTLDSHDDATGQWFITTGGVEGNPGPKTLSNWFKIEKYETDYKLVFCPSVCDYCKVLCRDIGIYYFKNGQRVLALTENSPFRIMFKRA